MKRGHIYIAKVEFKKNRHYHPIVCLSSELTKDGLFLACILSSKETPLGSIVENELLCSTDFVSKDSMGNKYPVRYLKGKSHFVKKALLKSADEIDDTTVGIMSESGVTKIEYFLNEQRPEQINYTISKYVEIIKEEREQIEHEYGFDEKLIVQ